MTGRHTHIDAWKLSVYEDPVILLRTTVDELLSPQAELTEQGVELFAIVAGPMWAPLLEQRLAQLRETGRECQALCDAIISAAARRSIHVPADVDHDRGGSARKRPVSMDGAA